MKYFKGFKLRENWHQCEGVRFAPRFEMADTLPAAYDATATLDVPVRDQGQAGTCWAHASTDVGNYRFAMLHGVIVAIAPQWLVDCDPDFSGQGCEGGNVALDMLVSKTDAGGQVGCVLEKDDPYVAKDQGEGYGEPFTRYFQFGEWAYVPFTDQTTQIPTTADIKAAIYNCGPVCAAVDADDNWQNYQGNDAVLPAKKSDPGSVDHLIVIVGWDDSKNAFKVKNSWGASYGNDGYLWVGYSDYNIGVATANLQGGVTLLQPIPGTDPTPTSAPAPTPTPTPVAALDTPGELTTEHILAQAASRLSTWVTVAGIVVTILPQVLEQFSTVVPQNSKAYAIGGAIIAACGIIGKALASAGYSYSRALVKAALIANKTP